MRLIAYFFLIILFTSGCVVAASSPKLAISKAWVRATGGAEMNMSGHSHMSEGEGEHSDGMNSAAYMVIRNTGNASDRLIGAECDAAAVVEIHMTTIEGEIMKMQKVEGIDIPAGGEVELKPGGYHVMLINLQRQLIAGERLNITLNFEKAGSITVEAEIRNP